jgi:uncharacterized protein DUF4388
MPELMKIQGHLSDCPLPDLLAMLANRGESGCLQVGFKPVPGIFYFKDGKLVQARMGRLEGFSAVNVAFSMAEAPFHFDNLVLPEESTINDQNERHLLSGLLGIRVSDREETHDGSESSMPVPVSTPAPSVPVGSNPTNNRSLANKDIRLVRTIRSQALSHQKLAASGLTMLLIAVLALIGFAVRFGRGNAANPATLGQTADSGDSTSSPPNTMQPGENRKPPAVSIDKPGHPITGPVAVNTRTLAAQAKDAASDRPVHAEQSIPSRAESDQKMTPPEEPRQSAGTSKIITVVVQIEAGRVTQAYVRDHRQGLEGYEATAIRLARQRRYSTRMTGKETVVVEVTR